MGTLRMEDTESDVFADDVSDAALEISEGSANGVPIGDVGELDSHSSLVNLLS